MYLLCSLIILIFFLPFASVAEIEPSPVRCLVSEVVKTTCGADFTVWLTSIQGASILYGLYSWSLLTSLQKEICSELFNILYILRKIHSAV